MHKKNESESICIQKVLVSIKDEISCDILNPLPLFAFACLFLSLALQGPKQESRQEARQPEPPAQETREGLLSTLAMFPFLVEGLSTPA
jgi:hypothetical protein